jgi:hypothetical protein
VQFWSFMHFLSRWGFSNIGALFILSYIWWGIYNLFRWLIVCNRYHLSGNGYSKFLFRQVFSCFRGLLASWLAVSLRSPGQLKFEFCVKGLHSFLSWINLSWRTVFISFITGLLLCINSWLIHATIEAGMYYGTKHVLNRLRNMLNTSSTYMFFQLMTV